MATKALLQAVRRNRERFPEDFMIQLTDPEWTILRSQTVTSNAQHGGRRYPPYAPCRQLIVQLGELCLICSNADTRIKVSSSVLGKAIGGSLLSQDAASSPRANDTASAASSIRRAGSLVMRSPILHLGTV